MGHGGEVKVFLDFEASSLSDRSYPIEVGWVAEDGAGESYLIAPAPGWEDWDPAAEAIHGIARPTLVAHGEPHDAVAGRMVATLSGHDLFASAPSWDGKWLSVLLRAAGLPRHILRVSDTDLALRDAAAAILRPVLPAERLERAVHDLVARATLPDPGPPAHRALDDARGEHGKWLRACQAARDLALAAR